MKNLKFSRLFAAITFVAVLALAGCKQPEDETKDPVARLLTADDAIIGTWADDSSYNPYDGYDCLISEDKIETASYGVHVGPVYINKVDETSGYLYYQFENDIPGWEQINGEWVQGTVPGTKGKWGAVAYKNLTVTSVNMCDMDNSEFASTLEEAKTMYTIDNERFAGLTVEWKRVK